MGEKVRGGRKMTSNAYNSDCIEYMRTMPDESVDLTVTSPPYDNLRNYNGNISQWSFEKFQQIANELYRITKTGGVVVWVVGDGTKNGSETGTSFRQALYFMEIGFNLHDTMIYEKAQSCFGSNLCYLQAFEYMFVLSKGRPKTINLIRDRKNVRSGEESMSVSGMSKDGVTSERHRKAMQEYGKRKNIWVYGVGGGKTHHPAVFPLKLAKDHIVTWSSEGDLVFDPFLGSGTTRIASWDLRRNFVGCEIDKNYFDKQEERFKNHTLKISLELF